ncbi:hypothetical protein JCM10207_002804 [Rhodosporidiobolus poonsookiae]
MPTPAEYKTQGNEAYAAKKYLKATKLYSKALEGEKDLVASASILSNRSAAYLFLQEYDKALADANLAVLRRPDWSKAYTRAAEVQARMQDFDAAEQSYELAIKRAEDPATKARYESALKITKEASAKALPKKHQAHLRSGKEADIWFNRLSKMAPEGFLMRGGGGLALSCNAWNSCKQGMAQLDDCMRTLHPNGAIEGMFSSQVVPDIAECILTDETGFHIPIGKDPKFPLAKKFDSIVLNEIRYHGGDKYFMNARWDAKDIVADMDKRVRTDGREKIRRLCSQMIRGLVIMAFAQMLRSDYGGAISQMKLAIGILEEGNRVWAHIPFEEKGMTFKPTFVRIARVYLLRCLIEGTRDAKTVSAKRMFKYEMVEDLANQILKENKREDWPMPDGTVSLIAYYVMPQWEAYSALAFVYSSRAQKPLHDLPGGKAAFADLALAAQAADYYDRAATLMPDDWHHKEQVLWYAMQLHLRAGWMPVSEFAARMDEVDRVAAETRDILLNKPDDKHGPRDFVTHQYNCLQSMPVLGDLRTNSARIKAVPTVNMRGAPKSFDPQKEFGKESFWVGKPGEIGLGDVVGGGAQA